MSLGEIYKHLLDARQIAPVLLKPLFPLYLRWYNQNKCCKYHPKAIGHSIDKCTSFKYKVANLLKFGWIVLDDDKIRPNINSNPLPTYELEGSVNAIKIDEEAVEKVLDLGKVEIPMKNLLGMLPKIEKVKSKPLLIW